MIDETRAVFAMAEADEPWARGALALALWRAGALDGVPERIAGPCALEISGDPRGAAEAWERAGRPWEAAAALSVSNDPEDLRRALTLLAPLGDRALSAKLAARLPQARGPRASTRGNPHGLTAREVEIVSLLADGLRNADIAARLFLSPKTVDHHVSAILAKLGARTRGEAAAKFRESK